MIDKSLDTLEEAIGHKPGKDEPSSASLMHAEKVQDAVFRATAEVERGGATPAQRKRLDALKGKAATAVRSLRGEK